MTTKTIGVTGIPTDFGTTRFPCGCITGWHKAAEIAQWAPCKVHAAAPELLEALENIVNFGKASEWDKAITGRQILLADAQAAIRKARGE